MSIPLKWVVGDRCRALGYDGVVEALAGGQATVRADSGETVVLAIRELELRNPPTPPTCDCDACGRRCEPEIVKLCAECHDAWLERDASPGSSDVTDSGRDGAK